MKLSHIDKIEETRVSHNDNIFKKVILKKGTIPNLMMFSRATFKKNQSVETHKHDTMFEVFFIQSGKAQFTVNNKTYTLEAGNCITIEPGEFHSQKNPFDEDVTWLYFGIATDG